MAVGAVLVLTCSRTARPCPASRPAPDAQARSFGAVHAQLRPWPWRVVWPGGRAGQRQTFRRGRGRGRGAGADLQLGGPPVPGIKASARRSGAVVWRGACPAQAVAVARGLAWWPCRPVPDAQARSWARCWCLPAVERAARAQHQGQRQALKTGRSASSRTGNPCRASNRQRQPLRPGRCPPIW
jgi:hypothetical protein